MIYLALIVVVLCLMLSLYYTKNDLFSPAVITSLVWLGSLSVYIILHHDLNPMKWQFVGALSLWMIGFVLCSLLAGKGHYKTIVSKEPAVLIRDIYILLSLVFLLHFRRYCLELLASHPDEPWGFVLRMAATGVEGYGDHPYGGLPVYMWKVTFLMELAFFSRKHWYRLLLASIGIVTFAVFTLSKTETLTILTFAAVTTCLKNGYRPKLRHLLIAAGVLLAGCVFLQTQRTHFQQVSDMFTLYFASSISAFNTIIPCSAEHWGEDVFVSVYHMLERFHLSSIEPVDFILPFVNVPIRTNTYTVLYPFFRDFGMVGVLIFSMLLGTLSGACYKMAKNGSCLAILLYGYFSIGLITQYSGDIFFTGILGHIYVLVLMIIPTLFHFPKRSNGA